MARQVLALVTLLLAAYVGSTSGRDCKLDPVQSDTMQRPPDPTPAPQPTPVVIRPQPPWPDSRREDIVDTIHGVEVADPYRWLEDEKKPEVKSWMDAQDAYARAEIAKLPGRDVLVARLKELFYYDSIDAPTHRKGRYFFTRKHKDKEKTVVYWKQGERGKVKVLFDPNTWSTDSTKGLGGWWPSWDGKLAAYAVHQNNSDENVTHVIDVATGKDLPDVIPGTKYSSASWTPDSEGFYYVWLPEVPADKIADRPGMAEVRYHALGTNPAKDPVIHPATGNPETFLGGGVSKDGKWLVVHIQHGWNATDVYYKSARDRDAPWKLLVEGSKLPTQAQFWVEVWKDRFYIYTNDGAPRYRVLVVDPAKPDRKDWKEIVAERSDAVLESVSIVGGKLVLPYLRNASSEIAIHDLDGNPVRKVELPGIGTSSGIAGQPDEDTGYFTFTSFTEPKSIYKTSIMTGKVNLWAQIELPVDTSVLTTEQVWFPSKDGTKISMFIISKKGTQKTGVNPTVLYGYGGFSASLTPAFASSRIPWLENGGVFAIPNLRGGGEYGEDWHRDGMLLEKQNSFDDFIAAARYLIDHKWTSSEKLAIYGASNGGLLVGAAMTQAPELFRAVVCGVPLLDMVRYHLFGSGKTWIPEYGSAADPVEFKVLHGYSPYHRVVERTKYPAMLMMSADHDERVDHMHARKFTAAVQYATDGERAVLLRIERNSGHGGADLVKQQVDQWADAYAWLASVLK